MPGALLAIPLGLVVGLSLGALGAGGSILTVPALVLVLGQTPHEAAATSLIVVGSTALTGAIAHRRRRATRLRAGLAFAAAGIVGSLLASAVSLRTDPAALALAFAAVMLLAAAMMWRSRRDDTHAPITVDHPVARTILAGSVVGAMTGFFGIGGGFLAVPALTWALAMPMTTAVGTSLLVIAANAAVALVPRVAAGLVDPTITALFAVGGIAGALVGTHVAHAIAPARLRRTFAIVIVVAAIALAVDTLAGLG